MKLRQCLNHIDESKKHQAEIEWEIFRLSDKYEDFKPVLVQVANALNNSKKNLEFTARYRRIKARHSHKKAIIAIYRMILTVIWHILTDLKPYTPENFPESRPVNESKVLTASQALNLLKQRGYIIKDDSVMRCLRIQFLVT